MMSRLMPPRAALVEVGGGDRRVVRNIRVVSASGGRGGDRGYHALQRTHQMYSSTPAER
jgi:hypothetical protein